MNRIMVPPIGGLLVVMFVRIVSHNEDVYDVVVHKNFIISNISKNRFNHNNQILNSKCNFG